MQIRNAREDDYISVIKVVDEWWGKRHVADMLHRLFFQHFQETSFIAEDDGQIVGFLIGFVSQTYLEQAYIHYAGVHPLVRQRGLGTQLYEHLFAAALDRGCTEVYCITAPQNKTSIAFHTKLGFEMEPGDAEVDGIPVRTDYGALGQNRVRFVRRFVAASAQSGQSALVVVDVQMAMFDEAGPVHQGPGLLNNLKTLITEARARGATVLYVQHQAAEGSPLAHGAPGWEIHPDIAPREGDIVIEKDTPDAFHRTNLNTILKKLGVHRIVLCGIQSEVCIDTTCRRAFSLGYDVVLAADAHSTWDHSGFTAKQIEAHENEVLRWFASVEKCKEITF